ncbi:UDP-glucose 4-epimerase GalE [Polynucleobacter sp. MWH-Svant-W18]|jgi:UDP-glucose 4-epimerase|uniref:UDP-glucose 4-epimerase GalE n=1 Tax=Polynucleobacter sp. MWH-Svant-W18 TaxID=1855909 RepID=UPI001BFDC6A6|nr:UDP-glucose 4-epimerase GalE [Polynucleobacter sp. MWH-Svant-W18]QWD78270.1 UDP-glucose 4-epimerase GalE [Polynucleobacter sp. MWH-Svant-W18]
MNILLTGGLGFIGSHTAVVLAQQGHQVVILDNLCNSQMEVLANLESITGKKLRFYEADIREGLALRKILSDNQIEAVMHFAGLKSVAESAQDPLKYYDNNVCGTINLIEAMQAEKINKFIFSSSATVYGVPQYLPYDEDHPLEPINTYGKTKLQVEEILQDLVKSDPSWSVVALRYFNPVGAHESGLIGESPKGVPNNLMPYICQVASGKLPHLNIFGDDYETKDGTGERDYIHVMDLAEGHVAALNFVNQHPGFHAINLGTGVSYSVYDLIGAFEQAANSTIVRKVQPRRSGDLAIYYAKADKAKNLLGWQAKRDLQVMCKSGWNFHKQKS